MSDQIWFALKFHGTMDYLSIASHFMCVDYAQNVCHLIIEMIILCLPIAAAQVIIYISIIYIKFALNILTTHFRFVNWTLSTYFNTVWWRSVCDGYQTHITISNLCFNMQCNFFVFLLFNRIFLTLHDDDFCVRDFFIETELLIENLLVRFFSFIFCAWTQFNNMVAPNDMRVRLRVWSNTVNG